ncbi:unnamed protein product [Durusdinium trenchii]|uniref:LRAT domain-containing protein n=1 Tax=Durusdinium trenchii TaxID=1381693 RepID=A0ABP0IQL6_9DINO
MDRPPTETAPPVTEPPVAAPRRSEWLECLIQHELRAGPEKKHAEVWVLRRPHINFFRRLLTLRGFWAHSSSSQLKCRERSIDAEMNCVDCVRLLHGGFYGHMGVAVPAHPKQEKVMGCLQLSKVLNVEANPADDQTNGAWDSAPTSQLRGKIRHEVRNVFEYTLVRRPADPEAVLQRALSRVGEDGYNLVWNNCEHFAAPGRQRQTRRRAGLLRSR